MFKINIHKVPELSPLVAVLINLVFVYLLYFIARIEYFFFNYTYFAPHLDTSSWLEILRGAWFFDTSAILYTNALWIVLMLFPLHLKENSLYHNICKWIFVIINSFTLILNLADSAYFPYTLRRTTTTIFSEFGNENNMGSVIFTELLNRWYLLILAGILIFILYKIYVTPSLHKKQLTWWRYSIITLASLAAIAPLCVAGMRGGFTTAVRPITISNANQYVQQPTEAALVLNTPFSLIRTIGKSVFITPDYYHNEQEMAQIFSPVHIPNANNRPMNKRNVVVLIIESFGREYIGALNKDLDGGRYKGYTPFVDSLISKSITFRYSYCNGRKSIDGMPSILSSIPMFVEPFFLTPASLNHVTGLAGILGKEGYQTAFFHGAQNGSMGFQAFARATGFQHYYGRENYNEDKRFNGEKDFDGTWAIWDEPFLQYFSAKMSEMSQPFMTALFTASSHHPYVIPEQYKHVYPEEGIVIHKCIRYTDMALRKFFTTARKQKWFKNTIFVLTSDHTNLSDHPEYQSDLGGFCSPIIIYDPQQENKAEIQDKVAQQIDILPTVMGMLNYQKPYFGFGIDLFNTPAKETFAVNYLNGIYQYVKYGYVLQFDGKQTRGVYRLSDRLMTENLIGKIQEQPKMESEIKAIIQQYMSRMNTDRLLP